MCIRDSNRAMSEALGEDVYHYHLHVVYIPVVEKQILGSKRCKDESLRGKMCIRDSPSAVHANRIASFKKILFLITEFVKSGLHFLDVYKRQVV